MVCLVGHSQSPTPADQGLNRGSGMVKSADTLNSPLPVGHQGPLVTGAVNRDVGLRNPVPSSAESASVVVVKEIRFLFDLDNSSLPLFKISDTQS